MRVLLLVFNPGPGIPREETRLMLLYNAVTEEGGVVLQASCGYLELAVNWITHVEALGITNWLTIAEDEVHHCLAPSHNTTLRSLVWRKRQNCQSLLIAWSQPYERINSGPAIADCLIAAHMPEPTASLQPAFQPEARSAQQ